MKNYTTGARASEQTARQISADIFEMTWNAMFFVFALDIFHFNKHYFNDTTSVIDR